MAFLTASLVWTPLFFSLMVVSAGQRIIRAEPGDNVILTSRAAENKDVIVVEWRRTDLGPGQKVLLYRNSQSDPELQLPSFKNRVDLLDVKNRDVSLVLKNVTTDDTGTYECRVVQGGTNEFMSISIINLIVKSGIKDGGMKTGPILVALLVFVVFCLLSLFLVAFMICKRQRNSSSKPEPLKAKR